MVDFCSNIYNLRSFEIKYVFIYKIYYIFIYVVIIYGYITNFECDQYLVGQIVYLLEYCICIWLF